MPSPGALAEREPWLRAALTGYRPEHFDAVGWRAHRLALLCYWAAPAWWLILAFVIAPALGLLGPHPG